MNSLTKDIYVKHTLGSLWILLLFVGLQAEDFSHTLFLDKPSAYLKEPLFLTFELNQTNADVVLLFDFDVVPSSDYRAIRVGVEEHDLHHALWQRYHYLIYPLKIDTIDIAFTLTKKVTTDASVAYSFSGDRDNVKGLVTKDYPIALSPLSVNIKPLPKGTQLVGDFNLSYHIDKHHADAYEPLSLGLTLSGKGYPPLIENLLHTPKEVHCFQDAPQVQSQHTLQGTHTSVDYTMALSAKKSFTLQTTQIKAFNPYTQASYLLTLPKQSFTIAPIVPSTLLDKKDTPAPLFSDFTWLGTLFNALMLFMAGFFTAVLLRKFPKKTKKHPHPLQEKIQQSKDAKTLLQLLMATDPQRFASCITTLETALYKNGKIDLNTLKKEAVDCI